MISISGPPSDGSGRTNIVGSNSLCSMFHEKGLIEDFHQAPVPIEQTKAMAPLIRSCCVLDVFVLHSHCISDKHSHSLLALCGAFDVFAFIISFTVVVVVNWS